MEDGGESACAEEAVLIHTILLLSLSIMLPSNAASIEVAATKITNRISNPLKWLVEADEKKQRSQFQERKEGRSTLSPKNHRLNRSHCSEQELKRPIRCEHRPKSRGFLSRVWKQLAKPLLECLAFHNNSLPYTLMNYLSLIAILGIRIGSVLWRSVRCDEHDHL